MERDGRQLAELKRTGWRVATIWECALKGRNRLPIEAVADACAAWLESDDRELGLSSDETRPAS